MISIDNLTPKQKAFLDIMWSLDTMDEVMEWMEGLSHDDRCTCTTLLRLVGLAYVDEAVDEDSDMKEAKAALKRIMK